jgi:hypothetical protein
MKTLWDKMFILIEMCGVVGFYTTFTAVNKLAVDCCTQWPKHVAGEHAVFE